MKANTASRVCLDVGLDQSNFSHNCGSAPPPSRIETMASHTGSLIRFDSERLSVWSRSGAKRFFDCACATLSLPILIPVFLVIALAIRLTSAGPILFRQKRMGRYGRCFTIVKFRTLSHRNDIAHQAVTTTSNQSFTPVGPFLRRWKLDELPQIWNVLVGDMSLVGPRPKLPEHQVSRLHCRPGITGAATLSFAREESALARLPKEKVNAIYHEFILPAKHSIDREYMARASFLSDLKLLMNTVLRRWDNAFIEGMLLKNLQIRPDGGGDRSIRGSEILSDTQQIKMRVEKRFSEA